MKECPCLISFGLGSTSVISRLGNRRTDVPYFTTRHFLPLSRLRDDFLGCSHISQDYRIMYKRNDIYIAQPVDAIARLLSAISAGKDTMKGCKKKIAIAIA